MSRPHSRGAARGFTLVELLVVMGVIAILAMLVLGAASRAMDSANASRCRSNLNQFGQAFFMYCKDYEDFLPAIGKPPQYKWWYQSLGLYMGTYESSRKVYTCPAKPQTLVGYAVNVRFADPFNLTHCWERTLPRGIIANPNGTIFIGDTGYPVDIKEPDPQKWREDSTIGPTCTQHNGDGSPVDGKLRFPYHAGYTLWTTDPSRPVPRHRGKMNCLMFDGSITSHQPADLLKKKYGEPGCLWDNQ